MAAIAVAVAGARDVAGDGDGVHDGLLRIVTRYTLSNGKGTTR